MVSYTCPDHSVAIFDSSHRYRYWLRRTWDSQRPTVNFIMLNPSTADDEVDDPTTRRCLGFAEAWGFGSLIVTNLFAYRSPYPEALARVATPEGRENQKYLVAATRVSQLIVVAWGIHGRIRNRHQLTLQLLHHQPLTALAVTRQGYPRHPLYLSRDLIPNPYPCSSHNPVQ